MSGTHHPESFEITWAGGEHPFLLTYAMLVALQSKCGHGPMAIYMRLADHSYNVEMVYETIRLGLIGGGMSDNKARVLADEHLKTERGQIAANTALAAAIIGRSVIGDGSEDDNDNNEDDNDGDEDDEGKDTLGK